MDAKNKWLESTTLKVDAADLIRKSQEKLTSNWNDVDHIDFTSRSHFARRYKKQYNELPQQTLIRGSAADKETCSNKSK